MKQHKIRVIISGGGTGGHVFPAIAIARAIERLHSESEFLFIGAKGRIEMEKVPLAGYPIEGLWISGLQRSLSLKNLSFPFKVMSSLYQSWRILRRFKPDIAIGVGGYASAPALWVASRMGIPTLIQEQNAFPGIANRILASSADAICVAYAGMEKYFPANHLHLTGNPIRQMVTNAVGLREEAAKYFGLEPTKPCLLVIGGSLGARTINRCIGEMMGEVIGAGYQLLWQTGKTHAETSKIMAAPYDKLGVVVSPFIDRMDLAYALADVVVSRAGAIAIAELASAGKAVVLVPSPNVTEDHQRKNAEALVVKQAALMILDAEADHKLKETVLGLLSNPEEKGQLANNIKKLASSHADEKIASLALQLISNKSNTR